MVPPISLMAATEFVGRRLHAGDLGADLVGRLGGLGGERLDLLRDHREALAGLAGARRLDGGVERQQVGLLGDRRDQLDDVADAAGRLRQFADARVGLLRLLDRLVGDPAGLLHLPADLVDRTGHLLGRRGDRLHVGGGFSEAPATDAGQVLGRRRRSWSACWRPLRALSPRSTRH